jgi:predicted SAM-dependent methyltransferase
MRKLIPTALKPLLKTFRREFYRAAYVRPPQASPYFCPICEAGLRKFRPITWGDTACYLCTSSERLRLAWLFLKRSTNLFDGIPKAMLHVAPEWQFVNELAAAVGPGYLTADFLDAAAMVQMDITNIQYPDEFFDVIYCSHVLEHVSDDRLAMREFARVLKPTGFAVILVPITADTTFEDPSVTDPKERLRVFGQEDHVRVYGPDFMERLKEAGLEVKKYSAADFLDSKEVERVHLTKLSGDVFYCTKPRV